MVNKITIYSALIPFLSRPAEWIHLAELSRELRIPHPTLRQWLSSFESEGVLKRETKGRLALYTLNAENNGILKYLALAEQDKLIQKCRKSLFLNHVVGAAQRQAESGIIIIFGSFAVNPEKAGDIDVIVTEKKDVPVLKKIAGFANKELHGLVIPDLTEISSALKGEIIKKHLILKGTESVLRWMLWQQSNGV